MNVYLFNSVFLFFQKSILSDVNALIKILISYNRPHNERYYRVGYDPKHKFYLQLHTNVFISQYNSINKTPRNIHTYFDAHSNTQHPSIFGMLTSTKGSIVYVPDLLGYKRVIIRLGSSKHEFCSLKIQHKLTAGFEN